MNLRELGIGQSARITKVGGKGALRQHFLDMGLIAGSEVTLIKLAPMGDPMELRLRGYELTLRLAEAEQIQIALLDRPAEMPNAPAACRGIEHPGLGEEGRYHRHGVAESQALPEGSSLNLALVGNQNCGKTTLFN